MYCMYLTFSNPMSLILITEKNWSSTSIPKYSVLQTTSTLYKYILLLLYKAGATSIICIFRQIDKKGKVKGKFIEIKSKKGKCKT